MASNQNGYAPTKSDEDDVTPVPSPLQPPPHNMTTPRVPLSKTQFIVVFISLALAILLAALDQTIVSTAIPTIVTEFQAADLISWVGTGYLLTAAALSPIYGKLADIFGRKLVFLVAIFIFEVGSLLCGLANSMIMLIIGRVIAGIGGGGIFNLVLIIISDIVSFQDRGKYQGIIGAVFGLASVIGPLAGGGFTDSSATWRWSFYINLPIGGFTFLVILFFLTFPKNAEEETTFKEKLFSIDYLGVALLITAITALLLPTQLGGTSWAWDAPQTIALFVAAAVLFFVFWLVEYRVAKQPVIPPAMFINASVYFSIGVAFFLGGAFFAVTYYVPLYFQVVSGDSATVSGLKTIPMIAGVVVFSIMSGQIISRTGYLVPFFFIAGTILTVGIGLLSTVNEFTEYWKLALMLFVSGVGVGCAIQTRILAAQASVQPSMIAIATSLSGFCQTLGGAIGIAIFGVVFSNTVYSELMSNFPAAYANAEFVEKLSNSPNAVRVILRSLPNNAFDTLFPIYLRAFTVALRYSFYAALPLSIMVFVCGLFVKAPARLPGQTKKQGDVEVGVKKLGDEVVVEDATKEGEESVQGEDTTVEEEEIAKQKA
ncbi:major facilitator superfamily domain-containing protein [Cladochytrium replicatum]|nr:major facilitator superfamily domain-containing protein [Cladochytrium replicatum]